MSTASIVQKGVHCFLQHALFVSNDHFRGMKLQKFFQTVVAVDHPAVKIVQVGCRKASTIQRHQRTKLWWNDRQDFQEHPFWLVVALAEAFNNLQTLDDGLAFLLAIGLLHLYPK